MTPRISRVRPLAGVEGGRVSIYGENLCAHDMGYPVPQFDGVESRPLIASPSKIVVPIPERAGSGFIRVAWSDVVVDLSLIHI